MDKIIFDVKCDDVYAVPTKLEFLYGTPHIKNNKLLMYPLCSGTIQVERGRFNSAEKFVVDVIAKKYPNAIILSRKNYAISLGLDNISDRQLAKMWRKNFRRDKWHKLLLKKLFPKRYKSEVEKRFLLRPYGTCETINEKRDFAKEASALINAL